jgi:hypothetical protein
MAARWLRRAIIEAEGFLMAMFMGDPAAMRPI